MMMLGSTNCASTQTPAITPTHTEYVDLASGEMYPAGPVCSKTGVFATGDSPTSLARPRWVTNFGFLEGRGYCRTAPDVFTPRCIHRGLIVDLIVCFCTLPIKTKIHPARITNFSPVFRSVRSSYNSCRRSSACRCDLRGEETAEPVGNVVCSSMGRCARGMGESTGGVTRSLTRLGSRNSRPSTGNRRSPVEELDCPASHNSQLAHE